MMKTGNYAVAGHSVRGHRRMTAGSTVRGAMVLKRLFELA